MQREQLLKERLAKEGRATKLEVELRMVAKSMRGARRQKSMRAASPAGPKILHCGYARASLRLNVGHAWLAGTLTKHVSRDTAAVPWPRTARARRGW